MSAQDEQNLYSLPYNRMPEFNNYEDLLNKPKINNHVLQGNMSTEDLGIVIPTKTSELTNDSHFVTSSELPTKTSDLVNDSGFITRTFADSTYALVGDIPTKVSDLINDSEFTTKTYVDGEIDALETKVEKLDGVTVVTNILAEQNFTTTFDNMTTAITTALTAIKTALQTGEQVEIKALKINIIGNLKPSECVIITPSTNISSLDIDWQGVIYTDGKLKAIDIVAEKVLSLTTDNTTNDDGYSDYSNDLTDYTCAIQYTKYKTITL